MKTLTDTEKLEIATHWLTERDYDLYIEACLIAEQNDDISIGEAVDIVIGNL